jgi:gluconolactonase
VVFEVTVDDAAEVWVDGRLPHALGDAGGPMMAGFNAPNRVVLTRDARPGQRFQIAVFGINGPASASPANYIWLRNATLDLYAPGRGPRAWEAPLEIERPAPGLDALVSQDARLERIAGGFEFTEGRVWSPDGALLFSSPNTNAIYRRSADDGRVTVFRSKSGYAGQDIGRFHQPGSNGLTLDPPGAPHDLPARQPADHPGDRGAPGRRITRPRHMIDRHLGGGAWTADGFGSSWRAG